jgi:mycothiol synthase
MRGLEQGRIANTMVITPPEGYTLRPPTRDDIPAIIDLIAAMDTSFYGAPDLFTADDIEGDWRRLTPETDAWVAVASNGALAAYATVSDNGFGQFNADCYVHPAYRGHGLGTAFVHIMERRARELIPNAPEHARVVLGNGVLLRDNVAREILEREGYTFIRVFWIMGIKLDAPPPTPQWPEGVTIRTFEPDKDEHATYEALEEAFSDHWGHVPRSYEQWSERFARSDFDPSLWYLAMDGEQIAGAVCCSQRPDQGWVNTLGVRRPWRQHGLGMALLRHAFAELYCRGERKMGLGVDSQSLTGASKLYERAGMRPTLEAAFYHKELRPGEDLSVQELAS